MRKILIVTERRADYSRFKPILKLLSKDNRFKYDLAVTGTHLLEKSGKTINEIIEDGFSIDFKFQMFSEDQDSPGSMVRALAVCLHEITYVIEKSKPDIILSGFDIAANLAITIAGAHMNIPVAHIQGGEVTGTIDESIRHSMSKFSHYHFAANSDAVSRLVKMGEEPDKVFDVGCPSIDALLAVKDDKLIYEKYKLKKEFLLVLQHPVTTEFGESSFQIKQTINAVLNSGIDSLFILPNNDAGYSPISKAVKNSGVKYIETLPLEDYVNLMKRSKALVGNSSSGIHETNIFNVPTINIGSRQNGRLRSNNVIDVGYDENEILHAIKKLELLQNLDFEKPYGNGNSAKIIVELLSKIDISQKIIQKRITY